ncbi:MAG: VOC family protein [Hormoscilla sp.]
MPITQCLHAAILVSDLERAEQFYGKVLGLPKVDRQLKFTGAWYQVGNFQIHLIENRDVAIALWNAEKWGRNQHLAFSVASLDETKQRLLANGCPIQMSASGRAALFTQDPDGNIIELSEV